MHFPRAFSNFNNVNYNMNYKLNYNPFFSQASKIPIKNPNNFEIKVIPTKSKPYLLIYKDKNISHSIRFRNNEKCSYINYTKLKNNNSYHTQKTKNYSNNKQLKYNTITNFHNYNRNKKINKNNEQLSKKTLSPNNFGNNKCTLIFNNYTERQFDTKKYKTFFKTIDESDKEIKTQRSRNNFNYFINAEKLNLKSNFLSHNKKFISISNKLNLLKEMKNSLNRQNKKTINEDDKNLNINNSTFSSDSEINLGFKLIKPKINQNSIYNITPDKREENYIQKPLLLKGANKPKLNVPNYSKINININININEK